MTKEDILLKLNPIFCKVFNNEKLKISIKTTPFDIDKWDSLNHVVLISDVEKEFGIRFSLDELLSIADVDSLVGSIEKKMSS